MKIDFALVCDYAIVDQYGKLSVLGIFQHIWVSRFPAMHPRLHFVMRLKGRRTEIGQHGVKIRLAGEADQELMTGEGTVTFSEPPAGVVDIEAATILVFDVPFPQAGRYEFQVKVDDGLETVVPLTVSLRPGAAESTSDRAKQ